MKRSLPNTPERASALRGRGDPKVELAAVAVCPVGNGKGKVGMVAEVVGAAECDVSRGSHDADEGGGGKNQERILCVMTEVKGEIQGRKRKLMR